MDRAVLQFVETWLQNWNSNFYQSFLFGQQTVVEVNIYLLGKMKDKFVCKDFLKLQEKGRKKYGLFNSLAEVVPSKSTYEGWNSLHIDHHNLEN